MKIFVCQMKPNVGDLSGNFKKIIQFYNEAEKVNADVCLLPELAVSGYMAGDLFLQTGFIDDTCTVNSKLIAMTKKTCLMLPTIIFEDGKLYNGVVAAQEGKIIGKTFKKKLPNYGVFDEKRYFVQGLASLIIVNNVKIGVPICEDIWFDDVCEQLKNDGAELFLVPNASPYEKGKFEKRVQVIQKIYQQTNIPIIYCNQVLGHDGIIFDGKSLCFDGSLKIIGKSFEVDQQLVQFENNQFKADQYYSANFDPYNDMLAAMILGLRDYVHDNGFNKVVIGLSGGIDSAMVAYIAASALGAEHVFTFMLPTKFTSQESVNDAQELANNLSINLKTIDISKILYAFAVELNITDDSSLTYQNLQSRIRGTILMAQANMLSALLITTGNKSEYAAGYATIYGDMNGAFNPIKDLYKTEIFALANYINRDKIYIPTQIITKPPSAELAHNQKDSDSLPDYFILDQILVDHIENNMSYSLLIKKYDAELVNKIINLVKNAEFKRKLSALGVKISKTNFEKDRRFPTTNFYK